MECKKISPLISKYIEGKISPDEEKLLREHIEKCFHCKAELMLYESMNLCAQEEYEIPDNFNKNIMDKLNRGSDLNTLKLKLFYALFAFVSAALGIFAMLSESESLSELCERYKICEKYSKYASYIEASFFNIKMVAEKDIRLIANQLSFVFHGFETAAFIIFIGIFALMTIYAAKKE